jgi:maltooligosyltrehalose trehalohydrolase
LTLWKASLGATFVGYGCRFRVWAPEASLVSVVLEGGGDYPMGKSADGYFHITVPGCEPGNLYRYRVDGQGPFPDPASRFQPRGVHGPSQIVDPSAFAWSDHGWTGIAREDLILYELHAGTFTPEGTFLSAAARLPELQELGVTAVELMPVADFAGDRNWGYDGVALFAPARCYGTPDELRRFVDTAHRLGLAVFLDVVYNHFGPDGAYHSAFSEHYFSKAHNSPWGDGINFDGPNSEPVRDFVIENALHWVHEYHVDGLRLDSTHAIVDDSPRHIVASLASAVRTSLAASGRRGIVIAEDVRNVASIVQAEHDGGWGLDAVWADDFHHQVRRALAGDHDGYYEDFDGSATAIAETARKGWFYCGQYAPHYGKERGTDPTGLEYTRFVLLLQNHDQIGNRAFGDRLHHTIDVAAYRAASALLLVLPEIPLLFMGQEWAASTPFLFFTDHHPELGLAVTEGRRREFGTFRAFANPEIRDAIPDPQALSTFVSSRLCRREREQEPHASVLRLYGALLALRKSEPALRGAGRSGELTAAASGEDALIIRREAGGREVLAVIRLRGAGAVDLGAWLADGGWQTVLTTEDPRFATDGVPPAIDLAGAAIRFERPGAVLLRKGEA